VLELYDAHALIDLLGARALTREDELVYPAGFTGHQMSPRFKKIVFIPGDRDLH